MKTQKDYFGCKCENDREILKSEIERIEKELKEAKKLGQVYFEDNKKKEEIIKMLSSPRKTGVHK